MKNFKAIIIACFTIFVTGSMAITPVVTKLYEGNSLLILFISLMLFICYLAVLDEGNISFKRIFNNPLIRYSLIIYSIIYIMYQITLIAILANNVFYLKTPMTISVIAILIIVLILAVNKDQINFNIFFLLIILSFVSLILFTIFFPKSTLKVTFNKEIRNYIYIFSYVIFLLDLIIYKLKFKNKDFTLNKKTMIIIITISCLVLSYYLYKDLTITSLKFNHSYFPNLLKYRIVGFNDNYHLDIIFLVWVIISMTFKIIIYGDTFRIFCKIKKTKKNIILVYSIIFLFANTIANQTRIDYNLLKYYLCITSVLSFIILLLIGGYNIARKIFRNKQR